MSYNRPRIFNREVPVGNGGAKNGGAVWEVDHL